MQKAKKKHVAEAFSELIERSGLKKAAVAKGMGFSHASGLQRYTDPALFGERNQYFRVDIVERAARILTGRGEPPILDAELYALANTTPPAKPGATADRSGFGMPKLPTFPPAEPENKLTQNAERGVYSEVGAREDAPQFAGLPRDLPVKGVAACGKHDDGDFILNGETVQYIKRPTVLLGVENAFAVYLTGDSMLPKYKPGKRVYVHTAQPPQIGDDVLVELYPESDNEPAGQAMVKELVARTPTKIRLKQHNPPDDRIEIDRKRVKHIYRIVPYDELLE